MTVQNPPLYLQSEAHPAEDFRRFFTALFGDRAGVLTSTDLAVTEKSGTPDMSVDVAAGSVIVAGSSDTYQGHYFAENRGTTNVTITAADGTNSRYDLIVVRIQDSGHDGGSTDTVSIEVVTGTAAATPLFPTVPASSFVLATVLVPNGASTITNSDITDIRDGNDSDGTTTLENEGFAAPIGARVVCTSATRPSTPIVGMAVYETDTGESRRWDGSTWDFTDRDQDGSWISYTPTLTNIAGTATAEYCRQGEDQVTVRVHVAHTGAGTAGTLFISLPLAAHSTWRNKYTGVPIFADDGTSTQYLGFLKIESGGTTVTFWSADSAGANALWTNAAPVTWASGDTFDFTFTYRAA